MTTTATERQAPKWLRLARQHQGMTQQDLADKSGMTQVAISHIETGRAQPRRSTQLLLAMVLGYEVAELFPRNGRTRSQELRDYAKEVRGK